MWGPFRCVRMSLPGLSSSPTSPWHLVGVTVQLTAGDRGVCTSAGNVTIMLDRVCSAVMWCLLDTHSIFLFPFTSPPMQHHVPSHTNWVVAYFIQRTATVIYMLTLCVQSHYIFLLNTWKINYCSVNFCWVNDFQGMHLIGMLMCSHRACVKPHEGCVKYVSYIVIQRFIRPKKVLAPFFFSTFLSMCTSMKFQCVTKGYVTLKKCRNLS